MEGMGTTAIRFAVGTGPFDEELASGLVLRRLSRALGQRAGGN